MILSKLKIILSLAYLTAISCLATTTAWAFLTLKNPVALPQISPSSQTIHPAPPFLNDTLTWAKPARDPFFKTPLSQKNTKDEPSANAGVKLKALILSLKKGVVLEDAAGAVHFLSEGESEGGITVTAISKTNVKGETSGGGFTFDIGGRQ